jgi:AbrB family looped-hinge helix DNA binding protein
MSVCYSHSMTLKAHRASRAVSKIQPGRQIVIPKEIYDGLGWKEGDLAEVTQRRNCISIKSAKPLDPDDTLTAEEE